MWDKQKYECIFNLELFAVGVSLSQLIYGDTITEFAMITHVTIKSKDSIDLDMHGMKGVLTASFICNVVEAHCYAVDKMN